MDTNYIGMIIMQIEIDDRIIDCNIQYGKGKKILINIDEIGFITVKAPNNISEEALISAIKQDQKWIKEKLDKISELKGRNRIRVYDGHGKFLYLGKEFYLQELIDTEGLNEEELKNNLKKFYISSCRKVIEERIKPYQKQLRVKHKGFDIVESTKQWGSCNSDKKLTFNYRLAMAPVEVIDYLIVHELCHILHMNHDRSFWRLVGSILPDYKKSQDYLMKYGYYMTF